MSCLCPGRVATRIHESDRNRPKELDVEEGPSHDFLDREQRAAMKGLFAAGKPPAEVAELVFSAIVEDRFWIFTDDVFREPIRARHRAIETAGEPAARGPILGPYVRDGDSG